MGEYHYTRAPATQWDTQLRLMKAAGIDIVASYVFWNHHQEQPGAFNWQGNRDLRRFVQLSQAAGLKVVVRLGPWAHGEARYGGIPDWVVDKMPTRSNDAEYLRHVERLYAEIGQQIRGLLWKDGGPVVGVQQVGPQGVVADVLLGLDGGVAVVLVPAELSAHGIIVLDDYEWAGIYRQQKIAEDAAATKLVRAAGLDSVMDRCVKIEHARLFGGLNWAGVNTGVISARRPV